MSTTMRALLTPLAAGVTFLALAGPSRGQDEDPVAQVKQAAREYEAAVKGQKAEALKGILTEDCVLVTADGRKLDRKAFLAALGGGSLRIEAIETSEVTVRVYGSTAVETGRVRTRGTSGDQPFEEEVLYTDVWVKKEGRWCLASEHCSYPAPNEK